MPIARHLRLMAPLLAAVLAVLGGAARAADTPAAPAARPFALVPARAVHILPETTSEESGYFSLCIGRDGRAYVGTAKYGENAFLVAFDPATAQQRIVIDAQKALGLTATGYAAQAKLHTRNHVGASGRIYVGTKQGYRRGDDTSEYPGGYVLAYDPAADRVSSYGMPRPGLGVIDVVADEARDQLYVVTCETEYWLQTRLSEPPAKPADYRRIGAEQELELYDYATTLVDGRGRANSITADYRLAQYDPASRALTVRPIVLPDGSVLGQPAGQTSRNAAIPTWRLAADGRSAYLIRMSEPTLFRIDLYSSDAEAVQAQALGRFLPRDKTDCRAGLDIAPDGRVFVVISEANDTGFGSGKLHHICSYDPATQKRTDHGVLAVTNPDFYAFPVLEKGQRLPFGQHGYHRLPDGTLTPLHNHMGLVVAADGSLYITILYPYSLLHVAAAALAPAP